MAFSAGSVSSCHSVMAEGWSTPPEGLGGLTWNKCQTSMYDMTTTTTAREFVRNFSRLKRAAANGGEVIVRDGTGRAFVFRAQEAGPSLASQLADLRGQLRTGVPVKSLKGFGRNRA